MAHNLAIDEKTGEAALYLLKEPAWHGLGQVVTEAKSAEEVIQIAHLDWDVVKVPNFIKSGDTFIENGSFSMIRSDNQDILGNIALKGYTPMQNRDMFEFMDALAMTSKDITYHTAGALGKGEIVFVSAKLPSYMRIKGTDDVIEKFILLSNSHNCSTAFVGQATDIRVVCANTHNAAMSGKNSSRVYLRHTSNMQDRIKQAQDVMNMEVAYNKEVEEAFNYMASLTVSDEKVKQALVILEECGYNFSPELKFIYGVFGDKCIRAQVNLDSKEVYISENILELSLFEVVSVLIEENEHFKTGFEDHTREFQTHFLRMYTQQLLKSAKIAL